MKKLVCLTMVFALLAPHVCYAWGPEASEAITLAALQTIRRSFPDALVGSENALFAGSRISDDELMDKFVRAGNVATPAVVVNREMNVLRDAAKIQVTEYFAYRFGVLAKITADSLVPFGLTRDDVDRSIKAQFEADIDTRLKSLRYQYEERRTLSSPTLYFEERMRFLDIGRTYIGDGYKSGAGYSDYARRAVPQYYRTSITAVADVWFTVLKDVKTRRAIKQKYLPPSPRELKLHSPKEVLVDFFVDEIIYFLSKEERQDIIDETYAIFSQLNRSPALAKPYDRLGDALLAAGQGSRAVAEYRKGLQIKPMWTELRDKIIRYYLTVGQEQLDARKLPEALLTYNALLEVDPANALGNRRNTDTLGEIAARDKRLDHTKELISKGNAVVRRALELETNGAFVDAIVQYKNSIALYESVTEEFPNERAEADDLLGEAENKIITIFESAIAKAEEIIALAEQRKVQFNWTGAITALQTVPTALELYDAEQFRSEYDEYFQSSETIKGKAASLEQAAQVSLQQALEQQQLGQPPPQ